ncbi:MAG: hypothetical protein ACTHJT_00860 [Cytophaga sp.]|uniref:hypothetical protein n=1 Tax=Cytophaga sp. TaxID=29535 RepID=UPI003F8021FD
MKKLITILSIVFLSSLSLLSNAQTQDELFNSVFKQEKRAYFSENMHLKADEFDKFWTIYGAFENERVSIGTERINLLKTYVEKYETMSNEDADAFMKKWLAVDKKEDAMRVKYYGKMKKDLGAKTAAHFLQLDDYIQTAIKFEILDELPFIGEFSN